jgi:PAS domain S-box-containing protein
MEFSLYALLPLLSAASLMLLLIYIQRFQGLPAVQPFTILLLVGIGYAFAAALVILSQDLSDKIFWAQLRLTLATFQGPLVLAIAVEFNHREQKLPLSSYIALSIIPMFTSYLALSSSPLIYYDNHVEAPYPFLVSRFGSWFWIYIIYIYTLECTALAIIIRSARRLPSFYARQHFWLLVSLVVPFLFDALYILHIFPRIRGFNLSSSLLTASAVSIAYAIVRFRLFDIMPTARYKVIETMQDSVIITDAWQRIADINPAGQQFLKTYFHAEQLIGLPLAPLVSAHAEWAVCYQGDQSCDLEVELADEVFFQVRVVSLLGDRRQNGHLTLLHDISARKRAEKDLQEREERLRLVLDHLPVPVFMTRVSDYTLLYLNEAGAKLAEISPEQAVGKPALDFYVSAMDRERLAADLLSQGSIQGQALLKRPTGDMFPALIAEVIIQFGGDDVILSIINDISAHKQAEQRAMEIITEREKVRALNSFIHSASHDFRTPMSIISTNAYLISKLTDQLEAHIHDADSAQIFTNLRAQSEIIKDSGDRLTHIMNGMLEITRLEYEYEYTFEPCDFNPMVEQLIKVASGIASQKSLVIQFCGAPDLPPVHIDALMMRRAVKELLDNAIYYTPEQGQIMVRTSVVDSHVELFICDTGIGIAETDIPYIFKAFYRADKARSTKTGGAGLGLAIAKRIVEAHRGQIRVESSLGQGSCFNLLLPIDPTPIVQ